MKNEQLEIDLADLICSDHAGHPGFREAWERVAKAARLGAAVEAASAAIVLGTPENDDHNCDYLGCSSFGPHVVYRKGNI